MNYKLIYFLVYLISCKVIWTIFLFLFFLLFKLARKKIYKKVRDCLQISGSPSFFSPHFVSTLSSFSLLHHPLSHPLLFYSPYSIASPIDIIFLSDLVIRQDYSTADYISVLSFEASLLEFLEATFARISLLKYFNILPLTCFPNIRFSSIMTINN